MAIPRLALLNDDDREELKQRAWTVLGEVGTVFKSARARGILERAGCSVDSDSLRVKFPHELLDHVTGLLSSTVLLAARDPDRDVLLDGSRTFFSSTGVAPHVMDDETGRRRAPTLADADAFTRLQDALDIVGLVSQVLSPASDDCDDLATLATMLGGTGKHLLLQLLDPEDVEPALEMVRLCAPQTDLVKRPLFSNIYCPVAPLQHEAPASEAALHLAEAGVPVVIWSGCVAGVTSPPTLAGTVVQNLCDELSAAVLLKLANPSCPIVLGAHSGVMDMRSGRFLAVSPEVALMALAEVEMAHELGAPALALTSVSNNWGRDVHAGLDAMWSVPVSMAGPDLFVGLGIVQAGQAASLAKLLLDAETAAGMQRLVSGIGLDAARSGIESVRAVGPGGHYLSLRETRDVARSAEYLSADLLRPVTYEEWEVGGGDTWPTARRRIAEVLEAHEPQRLPEGAEEEIAAVLQRTALRRDAHQCAR